MRSFSEACGLRSMLVRTPPSDPLVKQLIADIEETFGHENRGTLFSDLWDEKNNEIDAPTFDSPENDLAIPETVKSAYARHFPNAPEIINGRRLKRIMHSGVWFSTFNDSASNANVMIQAQERIVAARISFILESKVGERKEVLFCVQRYLPVLGNEANSDPFRKYPSIGAAIWHNQMDDEVMMISKRELVCHFARHQLTSSRIVAWPINRVSSMAV